MMSDIRYFWRAATVYAIMLRRKKDAFHLFSYCAGYDIPCYRTPAQQSASSNLTRKVQVHEKLDVPLLTTSSKVNLRLSHFKHQYVFVFGQTELPSCSGARVQVRLARPRMIRLHTPAVDRKTRGRGTEKAACAQND